MATGPKTVQNALQHLRTKLFSLKNETAEKRNAVRAHIQTLQKLQKHIEDLDTELKEIHAMDPSFSAALLGPEMITLHETTVQSAQKALNNAKFKMNAHINAAFKQRKTRRRRG